MPSEFTTVATYRYQSHAESAKLALEQAGINAFVHDAILNVLGPLSGYLYGWIKLDVPTDRAIEARALLEASPGLLWEDNPPAEALSDNSCLACGVEMTANDERCLACGWSFLDQPMPEAEAMEDSEDE